MEAVTGIPAGNEPLVFGNPEWAGAGFHSGSLPLDSFADFL